MISTSYKTATKELGSKSKIVPKLVHLIYAKSYNKLNSYKQLNSYKELERYYFQNLNKNFYFLIRWMKLEPIIQSEVSQKEKHKYGILMHIYGIQKDGNDDPKCKTAKETQM